MDDQEIEKRIDRVVANDIVVSRTVGGVAISTMGEVFEMAKMIAVSGIAIPKHLRGSPGACLAICVQAFEWQLSPFAVANKSYSVNDRLAYESQLIHAVVEARAPLKKRLRDKYKGEGPTRQCTISGTLKGEDEPFEYTSPMLQDIKVKNSPLWTSDPDQQLFYFSSRAWARRYVPDVILGIYADDELPGDSAMDVTPATASDLAQRIAAGKGDRSKGFDAKGIDRVLDHKPGEADPPAKPEAEVIAVVGEVIPPTKPAETPEKPSKPRSHKKKVEPAPPPPAAEVTHSEPPPPAQEEHGEPVTQEELDQVAEEFPDEEPTESPGMTNAREMLAKSEEALKGLVTLEDVRAYKATMRASIDALPDLTADEIDVIRGQFSTMMLTVEKALSKKGRR